MLNTMMPQKDMQEHRARLIKMGTSDALMLAQAFGEGNFDETQAVQGDMIGLDFKPASVMLPLE